MKLTVLVVDDEKNIRDGLGRFLELEGYDVKTAEDGKAALDLLNKGHVDLILSDLKMPRLSGEELLKAISTASPNISIQRTVDWSIMDGFQFQRYLRGGH